MNDIIPTAEEFAISIQECISGDHELDHVEMDNLMVTLLRQLGYDKAMDIFDSAYKWYA